MADFIVESFNCEYNLDVDRLNELILDYSHSSNDYNKDIYLKEYKTLYPEDKDVKTLNNKTINIKTIKKTLYFVQPPKNKLYSLKAKMLTDLRAKRKTVRKQMAQTSNPVEQTRLNSKQLAIKIIMNTEYGATANKMFAIYDPDVAAAVTYSTRSLIGFVTQNLTSQFINVDEQFIKDNEKDIELLKQTGCIKNIIKINDVSDLFEKRNRTLQRLYTEDYEPNVDEYYQIEISPSKVLYQDTDSNYYINETIINYYMQNPNPETVLQCMQTTVKHTEFMARFILDAINRRPVGVEFDGALLVCRYLNRKKKYYGLKYNEKKYKIPNPDGTYINLDEKVLLRDETNYLDYINSQGVKCVGVDLVRRDQFKFINYYHMKVLERDLRLLMLNNDKWELVDTKESMVSIIEELIESFKEFIEIHNRRNIDKENNEKLSIPFTVFDFIKSCTYKSDKANVARHIVNRLVDIIEQLESATNIDIIDDVINNEFGNDLFIDISDIEQEELIKKYNSYIPKHGEKISYLVMLTQDTKKIQNEGKKNTGKTSNRSVSLKEIYDRMQMIGITDENIIESKIFSNLDAKYYLSALIQSISTYIIGDVHDKKIKDIENGEYTEQDAKQEITKLQNEITNNYIDKYYTTGRNIFKEYKEKSKQSTNMKLCKKDPYFHTRITFPNFTDNVEIVKYKKPIRDKVEIELQKNELIFRDYEEVYKYLSTNNFSLPNYDKSSTKYKLYKEYKDKKQMEIMEKELTDYKERIIRYQIILQELEK